MAAADIRFRVMGSEAHVIVTGGNSRRLRQARRMLENLELRWSRFLSDSDVSRVNAAPGRPVDVHPDTIRLFETAEKGRHLTRGLFDPTVLSAVVARGYRSSIDDAMPDLEERRGPTARGGILVDRDRSKVRLEPGSGFDPGAIGKGLAADMVVEALIAGGTEGILVNIGGDLRVAGRPPSGDAWTVGVEHPFDRSSTPVVLHVEDGAVATSTARHGRWTAGGEPVCHVIDPTTGGVIDTDAAGVTVVAAEGWTAEVVATAALVAGVHAGLELIDELGLHGVVFDRAGLLHGSTRMGVPA